MLKELITLGLTRDEAQVYLAMLELGGGVVSRIAKKAGKHRATCYHTLGNLIDKGLASKLQKGSSLFFSPENPEKLLHQAQGRVDTAKSLLPQLLSIQNVLAKKPKIKFFEGRAGIESIFEDTLSADGEILGYTNLSALTQLFPDLIRRYTRKRRELGIRTRYLSPFPTPGSATVTSFFPNDKDLDLTEIVFVNRDEFPLQNEIAIYSGKVAMMSLSKDEMMAVLIESRLVANSMKAIFDLSWLGASSFITDPHFSRSSLD
jgi:predicted transcriptional regulator